MALLLKLYPTAGGMGGQGRMTCSGGGPPFLRRVPWRAPPPGDL